MQETKSKITSIGRQFLNRLTAMAAGFPFARTIMAAVMVGLICSRAAHATQITPEIDSSSAGSALALLAGSALVVRAHIGAKRK
jgi:hypothetical protein